MQARTLSPAAIFGFDIRYVIPLFQRPYVWNEQDQWAPLWADVRTVAETLLTAPAGYLGLEVSPHFLGAIVLDQLLARAGYIAARYVVDGQQRLTTLRLLLDAAQWVAQQHASKMDAQALDVLVRNKPEIAQQRQEIFKVWPTDRDQAAFEAAMDDDLKVPSELAGSAIARAHDFFAQEIRWWALDPEVPGDSESRLRALVQTLRDHLKLVVIDLEPGDNAQVIFETLNHRGAPLLAPDLIKNFVFQLADTQGLDVIALYRKYWQGLDGDYWRERIARGRQYVPRIDIFVNYWLVARFRQEVQADRIFTTFRDQVIKNKLEVPTVLAELSASANIYSSLEKWPADSAVGRFRYRVIQALNLAVVTPFVLWLLRWTPEELPMVQRDKALESVESWLVRRALCRYTTKDINRTMFDLIGRLDESGPTHAGDVVQDFLAAQTADSRVWPSDEALREAVRKEPLYSALLRARLRMVLEALEDRRRTGKSEEARCPRNLTVEHVLPQAWREHWAGDIVSEDQKQERDALLHTLGNLTLVNNKLNPALSNRPWTDQEAQTRGLGQSGKRTELAKHSTLKTERGPGAHGHIPVGSRPDPGTDGRADRTVLKIWPVPEKLAPQSSPASVEREAPQQAPEPNGKYAPLTQWLRAQTENELPATFDDLEEKLGAPLAPTARTHLQYWYSTSNSLAKAIAAGGFKASGVNLTEERLVLHRR